MASSASPFLKLPPEIHFKIFQAADLPQAELVKIPLICQQLYDIGNSLLYNFPWIPNSRLGVFRDRLVSNPNLIDLIHGLRATYLHGADVEILDDIFARCKKVQNLTYCIRDGRISPKISKLKNLRRLGLRIVGKKQVTDFANNLMVHPCLQALSIYVSPESELGSFANFYAPSITDLVLSFPSEQPISPSTLCTVVEIVRGCDNLISFTFSSPSPSFASYASDWNERIYREMTTTFTNCLRVRPELRRICVHLGTSAPFRPNTMTLDAADQDLDLIRGIFELCPNVEKLGISSRMLQHISYFEEKKLKWLRLNNLDITISHATHLKVLHGLLMAKAVDFKKIDLWTTRQVPKDLLVLAKDFAVTESQLGLVKVTYNGECKRGPWFHFLKEDSPF